MLAEASQFIKGLDRRVKVTILGTGIQDWSQQLTMQYNQLYATELGAGSVELGLLNSISAAINSVVSIPIGWATEKSVVKIMLFGLLCAIMSSTIFALAGNWWVLLLAFTLVGMARIMPLADLIFTTTTDPQQRATVMSLSRVVWGVLESFAPMIAALIITDSGGLNVQGIRPLYYIQLILVTFVFVFFARALKNLPGHNDRELVDSKASSLIQDFRELIRGERWFARWVAVRMAMQFSMSLSMPFVTLWMVAEKGATPYILGTMGTVSLMTSLVLHIPAGSLADKIGRKNVFFLLRPILYLGTLLMILAPSPEYLIVVGLLGAFAVGGTIGGGIGGVSFTPFITMFWETVPQEKKGRWYGVDGFMSIATIPASILGGFMWQKGYMTEVMLLPIIVEVLVVMPVLYTIPDTLARSR